MSTLKARSLRLLFGSCVGVGGLAALELLLRMTVAPPDVDYPALYRLHGADGFAMLEQSGMSLELLDGAHSLLQEDEELLWRLRPGLDLRATVSLSDGPPWRVRTNALGFRDEDQEADLIALGDSSTFGWGVDTAWPDHLEAMLGEPVLNLGVPGYSSLQGEVLLGERRPRVLILAFGANDGHQVLRSDAHSLQAPSTLAPSRLHLVQHGRRLLYRPWAQGTVVAWKAGLSQPRVDPEAFRAVHERLRAHAEQVLLVEVCVRDEYARVLEELDLPRVRYEGPTLDGCHPTAEGHEALADQLAALLR